MRWRAYLHTWTVARRLPAHHGGALYQSPASQPAAASTMAGMYPVTLITMMVTFYFLTSNYVVASPIAFFRHNLIVPLPVVGTPVGTNTDEGALLEPHQMAVDHQDLRRLHHLTGAMLGGTAPAAAGTPTESMPYSLPAVSRDDTKCPVCHQVFKTAHRMRQHMDVHKGMGYPCSKCHKSLSSKKML